MSATDRPIGPEDRAFAAEHTRAIIRAAIAVAQARIGLNDAHTHLGEPDVVDDIIGPAQLIQSATLLYVAVDVLTDVVVEAQVAMDARWS